VLDDQAYSEIIMTRVTVPVGEDIGFLPGTEEEKMGPWMGALEDNLEVLNKSEEVPANGARGHPRPGPLPIKIKSLNFMRGRTFLNKFLIIDEAQNLTPKQMKTLITRAGPGTKVVCLGNIAQIDTPYLTEGQFRPDLCGRPLQGLAPFRPHHPGARGNARGWPDHAAGTRAPHRRTRRRPHQGSTGARQGNLRLGAGKHRLRSVATRCWPR
jgi:PhoH-like ATPase